MALWPSVFAVVALVSVSATSDAQTFSQPRPLGTDLPVGAAAAERQRRFVQLIGTPFADTLRAIAGAPLAYRYTDTANYDAAALYHSAARRRLTEPPADTIEFFLGAFEPTQNGVTLPPYLVGRHRNEEWILAHETGHRFAYGQAASARHSRDYWHTLPGLIDRVRAERFGQERDSLVAIPNWYARASPTEHSAQAFANAVQYLRDTDRLPCTTTGLAAAERLRLVYDHDIPGTAETIDLLLGLPIYRRHMLNRARVMLLTDPIHTLGTP